MTCEGFQDLLRLGGNDVLPGFSVPLAEVFGG